MKQYVYTPADQPNVIPYVTSYYKDRFGFCMSETQLAREQGFIPDEEKFLLQMGDRQDLRLNMTKMADKEMENAVLEGLSKCNTDLAVGLDKAHLVKSQYYRRKKN